MFLAPSSVVTSIINTMTSHSNHSPGVVVSALADDGAAVKMVLQEDEQQPEHHDEGGGLKIGKLSPLYCLVSGLGGEVSGWAGIYLEFGPENRDSALTAAAATRPVETRPVLFGAWLGLVTGLGERFYLVMEFEQRVVYRQLVPLEPLHEAAHEGQPVDGHRHRHGAGCVRWWKEEEYEGAV